MKKSMTLSLLVLVTVAAGSMATTYNYPAGGTFATNPTGDWTLYTGPETWSKVGDLTLAVPNGPDSWISAATTYPIYKQYAENKWAISENPSWSDSAVLAFTCPQTGTYSLNFGVYTVSEYIPWSEGRPGITENVKVAVSTDNSSSAQILWSDTSYWTADGTSFKDFGAASGLQSIQLNAGDKILVSMDLVAYSNYGKVDTFIKPAGSGGAGDVGGSIEFVPEPTTLVLLLGTVVGFFRRKA